MYEQFAGIETDDLVGRDTRVRTPDPEITRRLLRRKTAEILGVYARLCGRPVYVPFKQVIDHMNASGHHDAASRGQTHAQCFEVIRSQASTRQRHNHCVLKRHMTLFLFRQLQERFPASG